MFGNIDENKKKFIESLYKNLEMNGFPKKSVSFPVEKVYELADKLQVNFNQVRDELTKLFIQTTTEGDKIIFKKVEVDTDSPFGQAMKMFENMSEEDRKNLFEKFQNMSDEEKSKIMEQGKKMGLV